MVCVHCGQKTQVINSRSQRRNNQVWRRRECLSCGAVFTTIEATDYSSAWTVRAKSGHFGPFSRDKLLMSLYRSCEHRSTALSDASYLSETVIKKLLTQVKDGSLSAATIARTAQVALSRFDKAASVSYQAFHKV